MRRSRKTAITDSWRLIVDGACSGPTNMARDEALLLIGVIPTIRIYGWTTPTISYGYFQEHADFASFTENRVRRLTGGGAILHDSELTFSITGVQSTPLLAQTENLYQQVHRAWQLALSDTYGIDVSFRGGNREKPDTIWCFSGGDPLDLICPQGLKLLGSAQRRSEHRVLLHGSLPLQPRLEQGGTGLSVLTGSDISWDEAWTNLRIPFLKALGIPISGADFTNSEFDRALEIEKKRYGDGRWLRHGRDWLRKADSSPKLSTSHDFR